MQVNVAEVTCCLLLAARCFANVKKILSPTIRSQCRGAQAGTPPGPGQRAGAPGCGAGALQVLSYRASAASTFVQNAMFASLLPDASLLQAEGVDTMVFGRARLSWARPSFDSPGLFPPPPRDTANDTGTAELASRGRGRGFRSEERGDTRGPDGGREEKEGGASVLSALQDSCLKQKDCAIRLVSELPSGEVVVAFPSHRIASPSPSPSPQTQCNHRIYDSFSWPLALNMGIKHDRSLSLQRRSVALFTPRLGSEEAAGRWDAV